MKTRPTKSLFSILLILLFVTALMTLAMPSYAKQASNGAVPKTVWGWCCQNGKIVRSTYTQCAKNKGHFFKNKQDAEGYLDAQTPGYCCLDGKVLSMKKGDCLKKKGHFFKDKKEATIYCDLHQTGYCCLDGKVTKMLKADCLKKKGKFFKDQKAARDACDPLGWCLLKGKITHTQKSACEKEKGRFFTKKAEADKAARSVSAIAKEKGHKKHAGTAGIVSPGLAGARPYLTVERLYIKRLAVFVEIKNRGKGRLSVSDYHRGSLVLKYGGTQKSWSLSKVDERGILNRGVTLTFATGVKPAPSQIIEAYFENVPGKGKALVSRPPFNKHVKAVGEPGKSPTTLGSGRMMTGKENRRITGSKAPKPVPMDLHTTSVTILQPGANWSYCVGETLNIHYQVSSNNMAGSSNRTTETASMFLVNTETGEQTLLHRIPLERQYTNGPKFFQVNWNIGRNFPTGTYVIKIMKETFVYTETAPFQILPDRATLEFYRPHQDAEFRAGESSISIDYRLPHRVLPTTITFRLVHRGQVFAEKTADFSQPPSTHGPYSMHVSFLIPRGVPGGNYYLFADTPRHNVTGLSQRFAIRANMGLFNLDNGMTIQILEPELDYSRYSRPLVEGGTTMRLRFSNGGGRGHSIRGVHLQLVSANPGADYGKVVYDYPDLYGESEPFTSKVVSVSLHPALPRGLYRFFAQSDVTSGDRYARCSAYSAVFMIEPPVVRDHRIATPSVRISMPREGQTVYGGREQVLWVQWSCSDYEGDWRDLSYRVSLLKGGTELHHMVIVPVKSEPIESSDVPSMTGTEDSTLSNSSSGAKHVGYRDVFFVSLTKWFSMAGRLSGSDYEVRVAMYKVWSDGRKRLIASATTHFTFINNAHDAYDFEHNPVRLIEPSGWGDRDVYIYGGTIRIRWEYHAPTREEAMRNRLRILLTRDGNRGQWVVASDIPPYPNHYDWVIPDDLPTGPGYRILIERTTGPGQSNSPYTFSIAENRRFHHNSIMDGE